MRWAAAATVDFKAPVCGEVDFESVKPLFDTAQGLQGDHSAVQSASPITYSSFLIGLAGPSRLVANV